MSARLPVVASSCSGDRISRDATAGVGAAVPPFSLVDLQRRRVRYLRLSLTDRCNFRCTYCMPAEGVAVEPRDQLLRFDEIERLCRVFIALRISHVRLTGGEPLVRREVTSLVERVAALPGLRDLAMTTNGHRLAELAAPLRRAGLRRLNVSLDSLDAATFARMSRTGQLAPVLEGLDAADQAGFGRGELPPTKINTVVMRGDNDDQIPALAAFCQTRGYVLRLIEYMPIGLDQRWGAATFVDAEEMRRHLRAAGWQLTVADGAALAGHTPVVGDSADAADPIASARGGGPARYWLASRPGDERPLRLGFITAVSDHFCATCNRVRVNAVGTLRECLSAPGRLSLRDAMRAGLTDAELTPLIADAMRGKVDGHRFIVGQRTIESMSAIGG